MWDSSLTATAATENLVLKMMVKDKKQKLNDGWQQILKQLEPSVKFQDVEKEPVMLYHKSLQRDTLPTCHWKGHLVRRSVASTSGSSSRNSHVAE